MNAELLDQKNENAVSFMSLQTHEIFILPWNTKGEVFLFEQLQGSLSVPLAFILKGFKKEIRIKRIYIEIYCPKCIM